MVVSLRPELQKMVEEKVKAGLFPSAEALINVAVEQVVSGDHLDPGEMERLLAVGKADVRAGRFVDFKSFPVQDDHHLLTVLRYVEANSFRSGIVECAQDWPFCSAAARQNHLPFPLTPWPIDRPRRLARTSQPAARRFHTTTPAPQRRPRSTLRRPFLGSENRPRTWPQLHPQATRKTKNINPATRGNAN